MVLMYIDMNKYLVTRHVNIYLYSILESKHFHLLRIIYKTYQSETFNRTLLFFFIVYYSFKIMYFLTAVLRTAYNNTAVLRSCILFFYNPEYFIF